MTDIPKLNSGRSKRAYRLAVKACMEVFFGVTAPEATRIVDAWWKRMAGSAVYRSGLFLHDEPINTAAGLLGVRVFTMPSSKRGEYGEILDRSWDDANPDLTVETLEARLVESPPSPFIHATSRPDELPVKQHRESPAATAGSKNKSKKHSRRQLAMQAKSLPAPV